MPIARSLAETFGAHADNIKNDIRKVLPATVIAVHPDRQTVDVQVAVNNVIFDDIGRGYSEPAPSLFDVPLCTLRGGGMLLWLPVSAGDSVLLVFSDLSTDTWRSGDGSAANPGWLGKHTLDSPFAIPCIAPDAKVLTAPPGDATSAIFGTDTTVAQIHITPTQIQIGHPVTDAIALASKVDANNSVIGGALGPTPITTPPQAIAAIEALRLVFNGPVPPPTIVATGSALVKCR